MNFIIALYLVQLINCGAEFQDLGGDICGNYGSNPKKNLDIDILNFGTSISNKFYELEKSLNAILIKKFIESCTKEDKAYDSSYENYYKKFVEKRNEVMKKIKSKRETAIIKYFECIFSNKEFESLKKTDANKYVAEKRKKIICFLNGCLEKLENAENIINNIDLTCCKSDCINEWVEKLFEELEPILKNFEESLKSLSDLEKQE